jgi:hypothetical protein
MADLTIPYALRTVDQNERHSTAVSRYRSLKHDTDLNPVILFTSADTEIGKKGDSVQNPYNDNIQQQMLSLLKEKNECSAYCFYVRRSSHNIATDIIKINIILTIEKKTTVGNEKMSRLFTTKSVP